MHASTESHRHQGSDGVGKVIRWAWGYDLLLAVLTLGRERRVRERMLDAAGVATGERVLDVGCGTGTLALLARERVGGAGAVSGVDAADEMVARARRKAEKVGAQVSFSVAPAQHLPFADGEFDVVFCTLVLHHLYEAGRSAALAEMRRVLKPGGRLLVVEIGSPATGKEGFSAARFIHSHDARDVFVEIQATLSAGGFGDLTTGSLSMAGLAYVLAHKAAPPG